MADDTINGTIDPSNDTQAPAGETAEERASRLEEANKKLFQRAKEAEALAKELKAKVTEVKPTISENREVKASDILKSPEFRLHREGYPEDLIEVIMANGGPSVLENKTSPITLGIQASMEQRKAEVAANMASNSSGVSDIERKFTEQDMRNMSKEDLAKLIPHTQD